MVNGDAVKCEQVWREICDYLEGDVEAARRAAMDEHFHECPRCRAVLEGTRNVIRLYGDERILEVPAGFSRRLEKRLAKNVRAERSGGYRWTAWLVPVAALALVAGGFEYASSHTFDYPLKTEHAQPGHDIPPDMVVVVADGTRVFHVAGCDFIHNKETARTLTVRDAMREGYVPCLRCMRKYLKTALAGHLKADLEAEEREELEHEPHHAGQ
jgi:Putative zinc-finger